ncbi:MAG: aldo/keto reductase [Myxococcaceae bacterium]|nr:aldo/keto reductase [Myxococcaceae bacterium]
MRALGRSGLQIPVIGLGSWLTLGVGLDEERGQACVRRAWERGVRFFDTADVYADGEAERALGRALAQVPRASVTIATKCFFPLAGRPEARGLSRAHIMESIAGSLERLQTSYVDLLQCHRFDRDTPLEETVEAMSELVRKGLIRSWGVSEWSAVQLVEALWCSQKLGAIAPISNQPMYNALQRRIELDVLDTCDAHELGVLTYSPLAQGVLSGKYRPGQAPPAGSRAAHPQAGAVLRARLDDAVLARVARLAPLAEQLNLSMAQLAIAWCLREPAVSCVLIGASSPAQVDEAVAAADITLSEDTLRRIDEVLGTAPFDQYAGRLHVRSKRT